MRAVTDYYRAANHTEAARWLRDNGFANVNGCWIDASNRYAVPEVMPASGKIVIRIGV